MKPVRAVDATAGYMVLWYDQASGEVVNGPASATGLPSGTNPGDYLTWNGLEWVVGTATVSMGSGAGETLQADSAVAVGTNAGNTSQGADSVAIGTLAGAYYQGESAIAIGAQAGYSISSDTQPANSICLNATGSPLMPVEPSSLVVAPVRAAVTTAGLATLFYNTTSKEVFTGTGFSLPAGTSASDYLYWDTTTSSWTAGFDSVRVGSGAGAVSQGTNSVAMAYRP